MEVKEIGMIGVGNMGGMMSLLFAEEDIHVHFFDPSSSNTEALQSHAREANLEEKITHHDNHESLCKVLTIRPRVIVFSVPHGIVGDTTIDDLKPWLEKGDMLLDASNEHWRRTEARQKRLDPDGIHLIGMGVSGGYQSARHGPSISPGGSQEALDAIFPFLETIAARDNKGRPCVAKLGPGGCGHFVKMAHNGIEQGMMTVLCEIWGLMNRGLGMSYEEIADVFERWNKDGPLRDNFLIDISSDICRQKDPKTGAFVLADIRDKVVQDVDETEGTGTWTCQEAVRLHVPAPTITAAHLFRLASADAFRRGVVCKAFGGVRGESGVSPSKIDIPDKTAFLEDLRAATYGAFLMCFVQGLHIISRANEEHGWMLDFAEVLQLWRGGCIIQSDFIVDMLETVYGSGEHDDDDLLGHAKIGGELTKTFPSLKKVVLKALETDAYVPALAASLEYYKYSGSTDLPTSFQEAQLDYFGAHMYDLKSADPGKPVTGAHHHEWKPAKRIRG